MSYTYQYIVFGDEEPTKNEVWTIINGGEGDYLVKDEETYEKDAMNDLGCIAEDVLLKKFDDLELEADSYVFVVVYPDKHPEDLKLFMVSLFFRLEALSREEYLI